MIYFDKIVIYSPILNSHLEYLRVVFNTLKKDQLFMNYEKCKSLLIMFLFWVLSSLLMVFRMISLRFCNYRVLNSNEYS